jgi:hypothetical protein
VAVAAAMVDPGESAEGVGVLPARELAGVAGQIEREIQQEAGRSLEVMGPGWCGCG